jgi:hypothetical protein
VSVSVQVECYSGYTYAQEPRAFEWHGRRYEVERIVKRWRTPSGPAFRVEVAGFKSQMASDSDLPPGTGKFQIAKLVDLYYLELEDQWTMTVCN